jgi:multidrug efflux system membrane fusion protein
MRALYAILIKKIIKNMFTIIKRRPFVLILPIAAVLLWMAIKPKSSSIDLAPPAETSTAFKVVVQKSQSALKDRFLPLVGRTEASRTANLQAQTAGAAQKFFVNEGDFVKSATLCVKIDEGDRRAKIASAKAAVKSTKDRYFISKKLLEKKYRSVMDVSLDYAAWQKALADLESAELDLAHTEIHAPFDSVVTKISSEEGEMLPLLSGEPVLQVASLDPLIVVAHVNELYRRYAQVGQPVEVLWEGIEQKKGTISFIDPVANESTHTFKIKITVDNKNHHIPGGLTTHLKLPLGQIQAHEIPAGSLVLSDQGTQGVYSVDGENKVQFYPAEIIDSTEEKVWVTGLPETVSLIIVGQGFVKEGVEVSPSFTGEPQ